AVQTAREMQMRLMPEEHPDLPGYDVCGVCVPTTQVGGDCFQYFSLREGSLGLCVADATGHAMQAAIPIVVFSGALQAEVHHQGSIMSLVTGLNRALVKIFELRTFVCLSVAELDAYPLAVREDIEYARHTVRLGRPTRHVLGRAGRGSGGHRGNAELGTRPRDHSAGLPGGTLLPRSDRFHHRPGTRIHQRPLLRERSNVPRFARTVGRTSIS
ncbi:MAG TPA: SpoIIE family protein phosphatase, partial [Candidatus Latescibacteria bacterium]|nr:SpoIIE family protein phosphatase [Candidatus Latescibacterota bacterium]